MMRNGFRVYRIIPILIVAMVAARCAIRQAKPNPVTTSNEQTFVDALTSDGTRWTVKRRGDAFIVDHPDRFTFTITTADGWSIVEASPARATFVSTGRPSSLTVYADGRAYCDGEFKSINPWMSDAGAIAAAHDSPAQISVAPQLGRVDRNTPGDEDNDGYNEARGAYQIVASGPRVDITIAPKTALLARPVLEISNLPPGNVIATIEGELVPSPRRLANGNVLIELPARLQRAATVVVCVE